MFNNKGRARLRANKTTHTLNSTDIINNKKWAVHYNYYYHMCVLYVWATDKRDKKMLVICWQIVEHTQTKLKSGNQFTWIRAHWPRNQSNFKQKFSDREIFMALFFMWLNFQIRQPIRQKWDIFLEIKKKSQNHANEL